MGVTDKYKDTDNLAESHSPSFVQSMAVQKRLTAVLERERMPPLDIMDCMREKTEGTPLNQVIIHGLMFAWY